MTELTVTATVENLEKVTEFVTTRLAELKWPSKVKSQIGIVVDELFGNIVHYAYPAGNGWATVRVEADHQSVSISFIDGGTPFDPLSCDTPDVTLSAEERGIGGMGIFMVKKLMDEISYEYRDGRNILTVKKMIEVSL